jgi:hypothetical protein
MANFYGIKLVMVAHTYNPSTQGVEAGGSEVQDQSEYIGRSYLKNSKIYIQSSFVSSSTPVISNHQVLLKYYYYFISSFSD